MIKKFLVLTVLLSSMLLTTRAEAALTMAQRKAAASTSATATLASGNFSINPGVGSLLVAVIIGHDTVSSVTDTIGNTYTATTNFNVAYTNNWASIYYAVNTTSATDAITVHFTTSSDYSVITAFEVTGA